MSSSNFFRSDRVWLLLILVVGAVLRFWNYDEVPWTQDELSALFRTRFDSFPELIEGGVKTDTHPAGLQTFLWIWTGLTGESPQMMKLPFAIAGLLAILLAYSLGKKWFNGTTGLLATAFMATLQYTVMHSVVARPYGSGLFLVLLMAYCWDMWANRRSERVWFWRIAYVVSAALCAYNHHFSLLFVALFWIGGLWVVERKRWLEYVLMGLGIFVLYSPHLPIFFHQLSQGGVEGWLAKPGSDWLWNYLGYVFMFSTLVLWVVIATIPLGVVSRFKRAERNEDKVWKVDWRFWILCGLWFFVPFLIGYFYSVEVNAVLVARVLIFSFPFLLFFLFGLIPDLPNLGKGLMVVLVLSVNTYTLVHQRQYYSVFYEFVFQRIHQDHEDWLSKAPEGSSALVATYPSIARYFEQSEGFDTSYTRLEHLAGLKGYQEWLFAQNGEQLYIGQLAETPTYVLAMAMDVYPIVEQVNFYHEGTTMVLSRHGSRMPRPAYRSVHVNDMDGQVPGWRISSLAGFVPGDGTYQMDSKVQWGPSFKATLSELTGHENDFIDVFARVRIDSLDGEVLLAASLQNGDSSFYFTASKYEHTVEDPRYPGWHTLVTTIKLSDIPLQGNDPDFKTFLWNKSGSVLDVDRMEVRVRRGNPKVYSLFRKIEPERAAEQ